MSGSAFSTSHTAMPAPLFRAIGAVAALLSNDELLVIVARENEPPPLASVVTRRAAAEVAVVEPTTPVMAGRPLIPQSEQVRTGYTEAYRATPAGTLAKRAIRRVP